MSFRADRSSALKLFLAFGLCGTLLLGHSMPAAAQRGFGGGASVGGVRIDAEGLLKTATVAEVHALEQLRRESFEPIPGDLKRPAELRKVSLRRLEAELAARHKAGKSLDDPMRYLAGLQRIRFVFVYPEQHDIVIAGYAEPWKIDSHSNTVGTTTGRPVMLLDDLIVALRTVRAGASTMSCSIDPTPEGLARLQQYASTMGAITDPQRDAQTIEQLLGPQTISITGVAATTHFAGVMVAADYRMKRLGMKLEPSPVPGLPSYLDMVRPGGRGMQSMTPRWWIVPHYDPLLRDDKGLAWEIRRASVKALTQDTLFSKQGSKSQTQHANPMAQLWAKNFTNKYDELSVKDTIFGQLRNCMDLAVLAALIVKQELCTAADYQLPLWLDDGKRPVRHVLVGLIA